MFFPIPKTGCISIKTLINFDKYNGHVFATQTQQLYPDLWKKCFKFCFVRNPWDRLVSIWGYFRTMGSGSPRYKGPNAKMSDIIKEMPDFKTLVLWVQKRTVFIDRHFYPQKTWVCNNQTILMNFVGRFERLQSDWNIICDKVGRERSILPKLNSSIHKPYVELYDKETIDIVHKLYADDIRLFGYKFKEIV